jgi:glucoamylase
MPRDIPVGNGKLLVTFDHQYQIRDIYFPHVGQENHAGAGPCRFGIYTDVPGQSRNQLAWTNQPGWTIRQRYLRDTLTTSVSLERRDLKLALYCNDVVDFHRPMLVRKIKIKNLAHQERKVQILHHQDFNMFGTKIGDTAYYDPELRSIVHYRAKRYLMVTFYSCGEQRIDEYATAPAVFTEPREPGAMPKTATCKATPSPRARWTAPLPITSPCPPTASSRFTWSSWPARAAKICSSCTSG